jgi:hypothetical protein
VRRLDARQAVQLINHDGEVNRARYMPQNSFMLATKTVRRASQRGAMLAHALRVSLSGLTQCCPCIALLQRRGVRV